MSRSPHKAPAAPARAAERSRESTEARLLAAVGEVLASEGFAGLGVNAVAKQAGVDKVLIYRYFGGLPQLLQAYGESGAFWPGVDELLGPDARSLLALPLAERYGQFFSRFIAALRERPLTLEILAAELVAPNELTEVLEAEREQWGQDVERIVGGPAFAAHPELRGVTLLLVAGVQYLLIRARRTNVFGGVELQSEAGWRLLESSVHAMAQRLLGEAGAAAQGAKPAAITSRK